MTHLIWPFKVKLKRHILRIRKNLIILPTHNLEMRELCHILFINQDVSDVICLFFTSSLNFLAENTDYKNFSAAATYTLHSGLSNMGEWGGSALPWTLLSPPERTLCSLHFWYLEYSRLKILLSKILNLEYSRFWFFQAKLQNLECSRFLFSIRKFLNLENVRF